MNLKNLQKASRLFSEARGKGWADHEPNTETLGHGTDQPENFKLNETGSHLRTSSLVQDFDWNSRPYSYKWNSLGLRGPEPNYNADKKILFVGNSFTLGCGVPLEDSFVYIASTELGYDYINLSDYYAFTDSIYRAIDICKSYQPDIVVLCNARFVSGTDYITRQVLRVIPKNIEKKQTIEALQDVYFEDAQKTIFMYENALLNSCKPDTKLAWFNHGFTERPDNDTLVSDLFGQKQIFDLSIADAIFYYDHNKMIDLGRDNRHPGLKSNRIVADILKENLKSILN